MNTNNNGDNYWNGIPEELKQMCLIEAWDYHYCTQGILKYLTDRMEDCEKSMSGVTALDYLKWVDRSMEMALYPVEFHEEDWKDNIEIIEQILNRAEQLLQKHAPEDYKTGYRTEFDDLHGVNFIEIAQHLDVYFCTLHMYKGEQEKLGARLESLLEATKRNINYLLSHRDADQFVEDDVFADSLDYHYSGTDVWEPLQWFYHTSWSELEAMKYCVVIYEKYALFLQDKSDETYYRNACMKLRYKAEDHMRTLCNLIIDWTEDEIELANVGEETESWEAEIEKYEKVINESFERDEMAIAKGAGFMYHQSNAAFTQKLRRLMSEYSTLPVIVSQFPDVDCDTVYLHDSETGAFREKAIAIFVGEQERKGNDEHWEKI